MQDAFKNGYRVGIVGNSDGHKGRPGASYPGAGWFGAVGGLTCFLMPELTRSSLIDCINTRHHYATTGGPSGRIRLQVLMSFDEPATLYLDDPSLAKNCKTKPCYQAMMGDIVYLPASAAHLKVSVDAAAPVLSVDLSLIHISEPTRPY